MVRRVCSNATNAIDIAGRFNGQPCSELGGFQSFQISVTFVALYAIQRKDSRL
jgi:hypothetical protein